METAHKEAIFQAMRDFKSHHSGMETWIIRAARPVTSLFKSHHSGMETGSWQPVALEGGHFKSHHSGMETRLGRAWTPALSPFKSHHSGMEAFLCGIGLKRRELWGDPGNRGGLGRC